MNAYAVQIIMTSRGQAISRPARTEIQNERHDRHAQGSAKRSEDIVDHTGAAALRQKADNSIALTVLVSSAIGRFMLEGGVTPLEALVVTLFGLTFVWLSFSVSTAFIGLFRYGLGRRTDASEAGERHPQDIALLVPIYNEVPWDVFGNAAAMLQELADGPATDRFTLFILSDTQDADIAAQERTAFRAPVCRVP